MSKKTLVIVESPGKIKKITEYLGEGYIVKASFGHCMDLDKKTLSIEVENNFNPIYVICEDKLKVVKELKSFAKNSEVILASDEDREGEAIAYSLSNLLNLKKPKRIVFHEITKKAIKEAVENPREIDINMVYAQQARRLLDRLVGYKISPILWKQMNTNTVQSAGRVQSVVLKIINDKEEEIKQSINMPYYKSTITLIHDKNKINGLLTKNSDNDIYKFLNHELAKDFITKINNKTIFKVINIQNKISIRKPSPPFITSTLQQEASTKLHFGVQKTMQIAQKLYEEGLITYMRTDSTCLSNDALNNCKNYIIKNFGEKYSKVNPYSINKQGSQEAHEAIRPTDVNYIISDNLNKDCIKLYDLILKRTLSSQMSPAEIDVQTIKIDTINNGKSILKDLDSLWVSIFESIIFDGFLLLYNDKNDDENSENNENKNNNKININNETILNFYSLKIKEEYTKLPLRFNEAGLVKYLEKNGIGRPSTYASIINKVIERKYVEIKNIEGITKESKVIELDKKYKIKEDIKEVILGKENKKIIPTELGINVNNFMITNFSPIIQIDFTVEFEKYLDMIADGKAKWFNILDKFYKMFNPIVIQLNDQIIVEKKKGKEDNYLMKHPETNKDIFIGSGKYGPYVKFTDDEKIRYVSIPSLDIESKTILELIKYPKYLGKYDKKKIYICSGKFGYYLKYNDKNISFDQEDLEKIDLNYCKKLLESNTNFSQKSFKIENTIINIKEGQYGPYLQIVNSKNKIIKNISIPKKIDIKNITLNIVKEIIEKN
jgi:DNA topoisomerase-1